MCSVLRIADICDIHKFISVPIFLNKDTCENFSYAFNSKSFLRFDSDDVL